MMEPTPSKRVLLIGKEGRSLESLRAIVRGLPFVTKVVLSTDRQTCLKLAMLEKPILVIFDLGEDEEESFSLIKELKSFEKSLPCIVLANSHRQGSAAWEAGADKVLLKGFSGKELYQTLLQLVNSRESLGLRRV